MKRLRHIKIGNACDLDRVHIQTLKLIHEKNITKLIKLLNESYKSGDMPQDGIKFVFITISKKYHRK